jgi:hypothetical protein
MMQFSASFRWAAGLALVTALAAGCTKKEESKIINVLGGGLAREVLASADGPVTIGKGDNNLTVKLPGHFVIIEKEHLSVDSEQHGKFPADARRFYVVYTNKTLTVMADGAEVHKATFTK